MSEELNNKFWQMGQIWSNRNVDILDEVCAPDAVFHVFPFGTLDIEAQKQFMLDFNDAFPDFEVDRLEDINKGDISVHRWKCSGTFTGKSAMMPVEPTGKETSANGNHLVHWRDGKIVEVFHYGDWLGWLIGAGVLPPLGAPA
jgi:ketosteroid isomerase-like protein